jgi:site-specific recombinase XerC
LVFPRREKKALKSPRRNRRRSKLGNSRDLRARQQDRTGTERVPKSNRVFDVLKRRCEGRQEGWVFPSKRAESAHLTTMTKRFREARVKAGLPKDLVLYCGRHDYGTRILKRTGNLAAVMRTMGHKNVKTAMQYLHPELEIVRAALDHDTAAEKRT